MFGPPNWPTHGLGGTLLGGTRIMLWYGLCGTCLSGTRKEKRYGIEDAILFNLLSKAISDRSEFETDVLVFRAFRLWK